MYGLQKNKILFNFFKNQHSKIYISQGIGKENVFLKKQARFPTKSEKDDLLKGVRKING